MESVLVQWRDCSDSKKEFLPRLGSAINHIAVSPDGTLLCTSHSDNSKETQETDSCVCVCVSLKGGGEG